MSSRRRRPTLEERLDQLSQLRHEPHSPATGRELRKALASRHHVVAAKAAKLVAELGLSDLSPDLVAAFDRFLEQPVKTDKGCLAKVAIAAALVELEQPAVDLFRRGIRHVQMEPSFGPPVDAAVELRAHCAIGLANSGYRDAVLELVPLLIDSGSSARLAAARGIAAAGGAEAETLLRFKVLAGDDEPEVLTECFVGLLELVPERSLDFVGEFLGDDDPLSGLLGGGDSTVAEAAVLALGESRLEAAVPILREQWERCCDRQRGQTILLALVTSRRESALDFLLGLVAGGEPWEASDAITALAIYRDDPRICDRVANALQRNRSRREIEPHFRREFS